MSGTSLDGIDAVLVEFTAGTLPGQQLACQYTDYSDSLRQELLALHTPDFNDLHHAACIANQLADHYAAIANELIQYSGIVPQAIACHGQTIRHRPEYAYSIQLVNAARLAELTGITVISDFRSRDIAAGGQGAPLVPAFHAAAMHHPERHRIVVNIGGIANLTWIAKSGKVAGFDCGPGNLLLDGWCQRHTGMRYDKNGDWGAQGKVLAELLARMLNHPFFLAAPPKSAGREQFNMAWLDAQLLGHETPVDVQATLVRFTASGIVQAIDSCYADTQDVFVCGGGAHNTAIINDLRQLSMKRNITLTDDIGFAADWLEAHAFAWLGWQTLQALPGNCPQVTGASHPCVLGAIYPA